MIKNNKNILVLLIIFILLHFSLNGLFLIETFEMRHWSSDPDDVIFPYNALLRNSSIDQEYFDHPAFFTFFIFSKFYIIFEFLNLIEFSDIEGFLNYPNIDEAFNQIFFISRIVSLLVSIYIIFLIYKILSYITDRKTDLFFLVLFFLISVGFMHESTRVESALISVAFLLTAYFFLIKFLKENSNKSFIYFTITILLIFSAMLQKKLVFFAIPFLFFSGYYFCEKKKDYLDIKLSKIKNILFLILIYASAFLYFYYETQIDISGNPKDRELDFVFLFLNFCSFNLLSFIYIKYFENRNYSFLIIFNIILGLTYLTYQQVLILFFNADISLWSVSFTNFMGQISMFASGNVNNEKSFDSFYIYFLRIFDELNFIIIKYFFSFTYQTVLIYVNLFLIFFFRKIVDKKSVITSAILLTGFLFFQMVCKFRYEDPTYYLFSEFLLIISLAIIIKNIKIDWKYFTFFSIIFVILIISNIENFKIIKKNNTLDGCKYFLTLIKTNDFGFYKNFLKQIPREKKSEFCKNKDYY